ncbi:carboxypeptidase-like regulatory domain-containing protein [Flavihumibacter sp.]|uniref:carboxypeptidase-like regulatory domain-containing protein n=1 Tax=Flavihumibacter sp. TaxID=1913981 RepID=UPI002FC6FD23|nr:carboxypeptidase-like regulatory domain-containing protein [Flavihumibacter sediminis]
MKKMQATALAFGVMAAGLFAFASIDGGSIKGTVTPAENVANVWAVSSTDTVRSILENGNFTINDLKPGDYKLVIEAKAPYRHTIKDSISVVDAQPVDVGMIALLEAATKPVPDSVTNQPAKDSVMKKPVVDTLKKEPVKDTTAAAKDTSAVKQ